MNKKKISIVIIVLLVVITIGFITFSNKKESPKTNNGNNNKVEETITDNTDTLQFLKSVAGIKANNVEITDNPVGVKGEFLAPEKSILSGVDYFLKETNNDKIENLEINLDNNTINIRVDYKVSKFIKVPVEVQVVPSLNKDKDLVLNIQKVKLLDMKLYDWIVDVSVNSFIKDWFPKESGLKVTFNEGNVVIDKDNFKGISIDSINLDKNNLKIDMFIDLQYLMTHK